MKGWIALHRRLLENPRFRDPEWLAVLVYLLLNATHQRRKMNFDGKLVELKPGQLITGRHAIAAATGVHESKVKRVLSVMKTDQLIDQQAGARGSIFTVRNWATYQNFDQLDGQEMTSQRPASDQLVTTNNNGTREQLDKDSHTAVEPSLEEVVKESVAAGQTADEAVRFFHFWCERSWSRNGVPIDWRANLRTWTPQRKSYARTRGEKQPDSRHALGF